MNEIAIDALMDAALGGVYARWRDEPKYRLNNLAGDTAAWRFIGLAELELLAFDQCIVFGATYPGSEHELTDAARRDAVVGQAREIAWAVYRAYARRASVERRLCLAREVAAAIEAGTGSSGSLLPIGACDEDGAVVAEAKAIRSRLLKRRAGYARSAPDITAW